MTTTQDFETPEQTIRQTFDGQKACALALRTSSWQARARKLQRLDVALTLRRQAFYAAFAKDLRKHPVEVDLTEFLPVIDEIAHARKHIARWTRARGVWPTIAALGTTGRVEYQPRGRCLVIGPWNYPVNALLGPLVSAIAAGNTVILKPSEMTPHVNAIVADLVREVFDVGEVAVLRGGIETARHLLDLPFDHIFFTGSPGVGKIVMGAAARHLASVTLELGGKSPVVVDESADLRHAAQFILWGKLTNAGQTCVAPDHVYVHDRVRDRFVQLCAELIRTRYGATPEAVASSPDLGRMINERHASRVAALIDDAVRRGATLVAGGGRDAADRYVAPTLLTDVPDEAAISREEIFGPVLPIQGFDALDAVIDKINAAPKPLALYMWSRDSGHSDRVRARTSSGSFCLNHCVQQYVHSNLPFGGINNSGLGNAHGEFGFKAFSHERAFLKSGPLLAVKLFFPPFSRRTSSLSWFLLRLISRA